MFGECFSMKNNISVAGCYNYTNVVLGLDA